MIYPKKLLKGQGKFIFLVGLLLTTFVTFLSPVSADPFYPDGDMHNCDFITTVGTQYNSIGGGGVRWNPADVRGESGNWIQTHRATSVIDPWFPNARRIPGVADRVAVPPNTHVDIGFWGYNYSGHRINVPQNYLYTSRSNRSLGDVTRLGAGGSWGTHCYLSSGVTYCRSGMSVVTGGVGGYNHRGNEYGRIIYSFDTIQPVQVVGFNNYAEWSGPNLTIRYELRVRNVSAYNLCNIRVRDVLPSGQVYDQNHCINAGQTRTVVYRANMGSNYPLTVTNDPATVYDNNRHVEAAAKPASWIHDRDPETKADIPMRDDQGAPPGWSAAQAIWGEVGGSLYEVELIPYNFDSSSVTLQLQPDLSITKTVSDGDESNVTHNTAQNREELTYRVTVRNDGARAEDVRALDDYDQNYVTITDNGGGSDNGNRLRWDINTLHHGASRSYTFRARISDLEHGDYTFYNDAWTESPSSGPARTTTDVYPRVVVAIDKVVSDSDETDVKSNTIQGDHYDESERYLHYKIDYSNAGDATAHDVVLTDSLGEFANAGLLDRVENISGGGTYDPSTNVIAWNVGTIGYGEAGIQTFDIAVLRHADQDRNIINRTTLDTREVPSVDSNTDTQILTPLLEIEKTDNRDIAEMGEILTYEVTFGNVGTGDAYNLVITDVLPEYVELVEGSISDSGVYDEGTRTIIWENTSDPGGISLDSGGGYAFTFEVLIPYKVITEDTTLVNNTQVETPTIPVIIASDTTFVPVPILEIEKTVFEPEIVTPTSVIAYEVIVRNTGNASAYEVVVIDTIPSQLDVLEDSISSNGSYNSDSRIITWNIGEIKEGEQVELTFEARVIFGEGVADGDFIQNQAIVESITNETVSSEVVYSEITCGYLEGTVWEDSNKNAIIEEGEYRIPNASVEVTVEDFEKYGATFVTDKEGHYIATCLPFEKDVYVDIIRPAGYTGQTTVDNYLVKLSQSGEKTIYELDESGTLLFVWAGGSFSHADLGLYRGSVLGAVAMTLTGQPLLLGLVVVASASTSGYIGFTWVRKRKLRDKK